MENKSTKPQIYAYPLIILLCCPLLLGAQHISKKAERCYVMAQEAFYARDLSAADTYIDKVLSMAPDYAEAWLMKAEIAAEQHDDSKGIMAFEKALALDSLLFPAAALRLARLYDGLMRYEEATQLLRWYLRHADGNKSNKESAEELLRNTIFRHYAVTHPVNFVPVSLGDMVNSIDEEYVNQLQLNGSRLLFTRRHHDIKDGGGDRLAECLYESLMTGDGWSVPNSIDIDWDYSQHMGAAVVSADGRTLLFTACGVDGSTTCNLYQSSWDGERWKRPILMSDINSAQWDSQPSLSADGREIFFSSRRNGAADIYHASLLDDGSWSMPMSLGDVINTDGVEMAPFIHPDGKTLYFSSNKRVGMGGFDVFMSRRDSLGQWSEPVNMGYPINTPYDEINFVVAADGVNAYISSYREGGAGGYDIYTFELEPSLRPDPVTYVLTEIYDEVSHEPIAARLCYYDAYDGTLMYSFEAPDGVALSVMPSRHSYSMEVSAKGYMFYQQQLLPDETSEVKPFETKVFLSPIKVGETAILDNINFEFDSADLTDDSSAGLIILARFLEDNPTAVVELAGHTDNIGSEKYNQKLSEQRALAVKEALRCLGVGVERITCKGYGSTRPIVDNENEEHRGENRRTELIITKM